MGNYVWAIWDYVRYETHDDAVPRLEAVFATQERAAAFADELNSQLHPSRDLGYAYDFRVEALEVQQ